MMVGGGIPIKRIYLGVPTGRASGMFKEVPGIDMQLSFSEQAGGVGAEIT